MKQFLIALYKSSKYLNAAQLIFDYGTAFAKDTLVTRFPGILLFARDCLGKLSVPGL